MKQNMTKPIKRPTGSVLMHKADEWEVRITPMNKVFVFNTLKDVTQWPYLDKKGTVKFEAVHSGNRPSTDPPQPIQDTVRKLLLAKRNIRQHHGDDFRETESQYVYS